MEVGASAVEQVLRKNDGDLPPLKWSDLSYVSTSRRTAWQGSDTSLEEIVTKLRQVEGAGPRSAADASRADEVIE